MLEHAEEEVVGDHQHAAVGEEDLEGADAFLHHRLHVGERALVGLRDRDVEAVVHVRAVGALRHSSSEERRPSGCCWITKSTMQVVPPAAAARVPVS